MTPEDRFRHSRAELPPMTPAEFICGPRVDGGAFTGYGWLAIGIATAILFAALALISFSAPSHSKDSRVIGLNFVAAMVSPETLDLEFERHVESETKALCKYEWAQGRSTMFPASGHDL
jgi:hypothetical protein